MPEKNIKLVIQYKGTDFAGWQYQPNTATVQEEIVRAIEMVTGQKVTLYGAGRTDAGVHALGQVANFKIDHYLPVEKYRDAINFYLPRTILINSAIEVSDDFNSRYAARWRFYRYIITREKSALYFDYHWQYDYELDIDRMNDLADMIVGKHDFAAFCVVASQKKNNECDIHSAAWRRHGSQMIFEIKGNRFLHTMVRSLVGTMSQVGHGNDVLTLDGFKDIINLGDHTRIKMVAPARGLYLVEVGY